MARAIEVQRLGKRYRLGERLPYRTVRDSIGRAIQGPGRALTRPNSRRADHPQRTPDREIWALRDVSLTVEAGEVLGVIGRNGSGKSTLLKLLAGVTEPTTGRVEMHGRVGSLLEVGTGFHQELTGRENVFFSGAILGMSRQEITRKFDDIVSFAGLERFIDTPVKRYSSGMYARLGFAVAAHLDPEILLVDEVLAVGDAEFQKRSLGKMSEAASAGRTVLFVSHDMTAITQICPRTVWLDGGYVIENGPTRAVVASYLREALETGGERRWDDESAPGNERVQLRAIRIVSGGSTGGLVNIDEEVSIEVDYAVLEPGIRNLCVNAHLLDRNGVTVLSTASTPAANAVEEEWFQQARPEGVFRSVCSIPANFLNDGRYYVSVFLVTFGIGVEAEARETIGFDALDTGAMAEPGGRREWPGVVRVRLPWSTELIEKRAEARVV